MSPTDVSTGRARGRDGPSAVSSVLRVVPARPAVLVRPRPWPVKIPARTSKSATRKIYTLYCKHCSYECETVLRETCPKCMNDRVRLTPFDNYTAKCRCGREIFILDSIEAERGTLKCSQGFLYCDCGEEIEIGGEGGR